MFKVDILILGAPKSGTSTLHNWLNSHPSLQGSYPKETYAFLSDEFKSYNSLGVNINNLDGLSKFYNEKVNSLFKFESTSQTLYSLKSIDSIKNYNKNIKVIIITRDPIQRILSTYNYYKYTKVNNDVHETFEAYVDALINCKANIGNDLYDKALEWSNYDYYIEHWIRKIGNDNVYVVDFKDLFSNSVVEMKKIQEFLCVEDLIDESIYFSKENESLKFKNRLLHRTVSYLSSYLKDSDMRKNLRAIYRKINSSKIEKHDKSIEAETIERLNNAILDLVNHR